MTDGRDPVERGATGGRDLYEIATWEVRSPLDRAAAWLYAGGLLVGRWLVVGAALALFGLQFLAGDLLATVLDPAFLMLLALSVIPALALAVYIRRADATAPQPWSALVVTYALGVLFAMFAAVLNGLAAGPLSGLGAVGVVVLFFFVVGPVEEAVKLAAVRVFAYRKGRLASVVDGAVYGAVAGLGFATIENLLYISRSVGAAGDAALLGAAGSTAFARALAGPGHVVYSGIAGYYLGLARFNPDHRGPLVVKGLVLAAGIHGLYNTLVTALPVVAPSVMGRSPDPLVWQVVVIVGYVGLFGWLLYRKLNRYAAVLAAVTEPDREDVAPELTEFDSPVDTAAAREGRRRDRDRR